MTLSSLILRLREPLQAGEAHTQSGLLPRNSFSRGAHEAVVQARLPKSAGRPFSCQVAVSLEAEIEKEHK
jgi:hypothetical protein